MRFSRCFSTGIGGVARLLSLERATNDVSVKGWVTSVQRFGRMFFVKIEDGTSPQMIQAVLPRKLFSAPLNVGSALSVRGNWVPSRGAQQSMELFVEKVDAVGYNEKPVLPTENDLLRQKPHLRAKNPAFGAILRLRSHLNFLTHQFFAEKNFVHIDTPLTSRNDCEGAGEVFTIKSFAEDDFFGDADVFLPVSSQLHLEAMASALPNVYTIAPTFRANGSTSRQHLAEFRMLEAECAFVESVDEICRLVEDYLRFVAARIRRFEADLSASLPLCRRTKHLLEWICADRPIPRISHAEAVEILRQRGVWSGGKLAKSDELALVDVLGGPVFVLNYPLETYKLPFYMKRSEDGLFAQNVDLLAPFVGELAGGSVREDDLEALRARLSAMYGTKTSGKSSKSSKQREEDGLVHDDVDADEAEDEDDDRLDWYLELRRAGYPRSAGFGLGVERLTQSLLGVENIKDTLPFPRWSKNCKC